MSKNKPQATADEIHASLINEKSGASALASLEVMHNQILVAIWMRGEKIGNLFIPEKTQDEDRWQGKVGLVLKAGPMAFQNEGNTDFHGQSVNDGDWVIYRVSDGLSIDVNGVHCRLIEDVHIKGRVADPSVIY